MKMKCRLCELTTVVNHQQKLVAACTHALQPPPLPPPPGTPSVSLGPAALGHLYHFAGFVPHLRDMMLAACLFRGYYQPAGPLITAHHGHSHPPPLPVPIGKAAASSLEPSPSPTPPPQTTHQPPPSSTGTAESSDNEVIITSASSGGGGAASDPVPIALPLPAQSYRYTATTTQYPPPPPPPHGPPPPPPGYSYTTAAAAYPPPSQYYHHPPPPTATFAAQQQQQQQHFHHDICYPSAAAGYPASYIHPKAYATTFRRYLPAPPPPPPPAGPQYYQTNPELYPAPPPTQSQAASSQVVSASAGAAGGSSYQQGPSGPPPTATLVESYAPPPASIVEPYPPPPPHYYTGYSTGPAPPACYTHSPPTRNLAFIDAAYQSCPCPMQSCPKNVHTGPLTGDGKRSSAIAKESGVPLPPVALALPLEPASVAGPPSPARGSAGMPPPPSPAGATYQPTPTPTTTPVPAGAQHHHHHHHHQQQQPPTPPPVLTSATSQNSTNNIGNNNNNTGNNNTGNNGNGNNKGCPVSSEKRNKARVGKQMARNNIMLLMCHNGPPVTPPDNPVKREVESPEETKAMLISSTPSTPPPTPTPPPAVLTAMGPPVETKCEQTDIMHGGKTEPQIVGGEMFAEKLLLKSEHQPPPLPLPPVSPEFKKYLKNETCEEEEDSMPGEADVTRRKSVQQQLEQEIINNNNNSRRKSVQQMEETNSSSSSSSSSVCEPKLKHETALPTSGTIVTSTLVVERASVKRKQSVTRESPEDEGAKVPVKKQKPNNVKASKANGSYKDLIKKNDKCVAVASSVDVKPPERKFLLYKTPKIMLGGGRHKKNTKRKAFTNKDEPTSKRMKTSKPLVASNLHNSKQNTASAKVNKQQLQQKQTNHSCEITSNVKKASQKKSQVNSKSHSCIGSSSSSSSSSSNSGSNNCSASLSNVDRTIESVVANSGEQWEDKVQATSTTPTAALTTTSTATTTTTTPPPATAVALRTSGAASTVARGTALVTCRGVGSGRAGTSRRKSKASTSSSAVSGPCGALTVGVLVPPMPAALVSRAPRKSLHMPRWSNGWSWDGEPFQGKVFLNSDEALVVRKCYPAMRHTEGDLICPRDCVLLKAGPRKVDLPFVAKVAALWEDDDGEMMVSLLWYYRPEHTDQGRRPIDQPDEVFASRHKDTNSVACIEDKCYVLTFNEYCRYRKTVRRLEEGLQHTGQVVPMPEGGTYHRQHRQPPAPLNTAPELVFFCRQVYDFRQKRIMKNPS